MTLTHQEFIRRFALHILPKNFTSSVCPLGSCVKILQYGFSSSIT
ncbi:transposase [Flavobacterium sp. XS1P32]